MENGNKKIVDIRKKRKQKKGWKKKILVFLLLCFSVFVLLFSPIFNINDIEVVGSSKIDKITIINTTGLYAGQNIFRINKINIKEKILLLPYIESVKIQRKLPNRVYIEVKEKEPIAAIEFMGSNIYIDSKEYILESVLSDEDKVEIPHITGFNLSTIVVGEKIKVNNIEDLQKIIRVLNEIKINGYISDIKSGYLDENKNIILNTRNGQEVKLGETSNLNYKAILLKEIMQREQGNMMIDISNIDKPITRPI